MLLLDVTIVNVALPSIQSSLHANFSDLQWVVDAYSLTLAALLLTTGSLADLWGRRLIFVIGLVVFTGSSLASGLAQSPLWLNLARGAQGVGAAAMFSTGLALLGSSFQGRERGVAFGIWGAITGLAVAIGPVVGGALTTSLSWRWIFLVNVPIGAAAMVISLLRVDESKMSHARKPDPIGVVTFSGALAALVYALIKGNQKGWTNEVIQGCLIAAGVLLVLFLIAEWLQRDRAMFDLRLFRKPTFTGGAIAAFGLSAGLFALFLYLTLYLQDVLGFSALQTGLRFIVLSGGMLLTSFLAGRLTAVVPIRFLIAPGLLMVGIGILLMRGITASTGWTHLIPGFILAGAGTGLINPPLASTAIGVVRPERAGMASGINSTFRQVGIATGIAGMGAIFSHQVRTTIESMLSGSAQISATQAHALAGSVASGSGARAGIQAIPAAARAQAAHVLKAGFASGLNEIFLVGAILSLVSAALTLILIRSKDFEVGAARTVGRPGQPPAAAPVGTGPDKPGPPAAEPAGAAQAPDATVTAGAAAGSPPAGVDRAPEDGATNQNGARNGSELQVGNAPADIQGNEHPRREAIQVSDQSAAGGFAPYSNGAESDSGPLHQRMSGYGYQSPLPASPAPFSLARVEPVSDQGSDKSADSGQSPAASAPRRYQGWQKPSEAWLAASQAWQTLSEPGQSTDIEKSPPDLEQSRAFVEQALSAVEPSTSYVEPASSEMESSTSYVEPASSEMESSTSYVEPLSTDLEPSDVDPSQSYVEPTPSDLEPSPSNDEQSPSDLEQASPEADGTPEETAPAGLSAVPAARSFWSRFSSASPSSPSPSSDSAVDTPLHEASSPAPEPEPEPTAPVAEEPAPEPEAEATMPVVEESLPEPEADAPMPADVTPEPGPVAETTMPVAETTAPDPEPASEAEPEPEVGATTPVAEASVPEPEASAEPQPEPAAQLTAESRGRSDLPSDQDVPMSPPAPGPSSSPSTEFGAAPPASEMGPATRDVRLVVQAVQSAEEAALAYAREIGQARRHLAAAIQHLDRAETARALLTQHAAGFSSAPPAGPSSPAPGDPGFSPARDFGSGDSERSGGTVTTPSPGIAVATPAGPITGPRGSAAAEVGGSDVLGNPSDEETDYGTSGFSHADDTPSQPDRIGHSDSSSDGPHSFASEDGGSYGPADLRPVPNPPVPPPPRPGGWGPRD